MKKNSILLNWSIIIIIVGLLSYVGWTFITSDDSNKYDREQNEGVQKGNIAPDFELELITGESIKLSDFRGEKVMLNFWATWCPPCREEMPDMQKLHENEDIKILAVNLFDQEFNKEEVEVFLKEYDIGFDILLDKDTSVSMTYEINPIPTTFLINSDGKIHNVAYGALSYEKMLEEYKKMK